MDDKIKIGFIGLGQRGKGWLGAVLKSFADDLQVVAVCDVYPDRVKDTVELIEKESGVKAAGYVNAEDLFGDGNVKAVIISAAWEAHIPLAIKAMESGKITALEVGGAYSVDDCWQLVRTYEKTKTPFFFMENCCYGKKELLATGMARKGLLGEIVYCHGAYCHDLREEISYGVKNRHYRLRNYLSRNCDNYPTHELGPIAKLLDINRGNRMVSLASFSSKARGLETFVLNHEDLADLHGKRFMQGDVVETVITCADGTLISLKLDTTLPHAYSREFTVNGTKGVYSEIGNIALTEGKFDHEKNMDDYFDTAKEYENECLPKVWREMTPEQIEAGHGGMDFLMMREFIAAVKNNKEMPIDVYDAAAWMVITCLSEDSVANGGQSVAIPDFTNGQWVMRERKDVTEF